jgi:hypothetical protein
VDPCGTACGGKKLFNLKCLKLFKFEIMFMYSVVCVSSHSVVCTAMTGQMMRLTVAGESLWLSVFQ